jgi:hypothetical protein
MKTTNRWLEDIISPKVGHEPMGSGFGLVEGVKTYFVAPTFLNMLSYELIGIESGLVHNKVTTSFGLLSSQDLISDR